MKTFYLKSLGCKQNQLEGQIITNELLSLGYIIAPDIQNSDIYILNSCSVTSHADSQVSYLLNQAKRTNPNIKTILTGSSVSIPFIRGEFELDRFQRILLFDFDYKKRARSVIIQMIY